jgi:hypothetical protein
MLRNRSWIAKALSTGLAVFAVGCGDDGGGHGADASADAGPDSGTDTDTDGGADVDTDTDTDAEECSDEDTFDPAECPAIGPADTKLRYVNAAVEEPIEGISWETAFASVQPAIDACRCVTLALGEACQVWVAAGVYPTDPTNRCDAIRLRPNVALYGGFTGVETSLEARDWEENVTTLTGGGLAYHVVRGASEAVIDGFTITGGRADGSAENDQSSGGGMYNDGASPIVANCTVAYNLAESAGCGMFNTDS